MLQRMSNLYYFIGYYCVDMADDVGRLRLNTEAQYFELVMECSLVGWELRGA
jgi:hypothetical protein